MKNIGKMLNDRRTALELSLEDVAKELGVNRSTVFRWEKGDIRSLKRGHIFILSDLLYIPIEAFFDDNPNTELEDAGLVKEKKRVKKLIDNIEDSSQLRDVAKYISLFILQK